MFPQKLFPALIIINQHIKNDFWRSSDTKDWSDDVKNSALHHSNKLHKKIYILNLILFYYISVLLYQFIKHMQPLSLKDFKTLHNF